MADPQKRIQGRMGARHLNSRALRKADGGIDLREPPLIVGNVVRLNSGSPRMLVVDAMPGIMTITVAYRLNVNGRWVVKEWDLARTCVHRVRDAW